MWRSTMNIHSIQPAFKGFIQTTYEDWHNGYLKHITFNTNEINFEQINYCTSDLTKVTSQGKEYKIPCSYKKFTEACRKASQTNSSFVKLDI